MADPRYEQKTNKRTGETAWFRSDDDGATWRIDRSYQPESKIVQMPTVEIEGSVPKPAPKPQGGGFADWMDAAARSGSGMLSDPINKVVAGRDAVENAIQTAAFSRGVQLPGFRPPQTEGRGTGAPPRGFDSYMQEQVAGNERAAENYPLTTAAGKALTSIGQAMAVPQMQAAKGAPLLHRAALGVGNIAADAALGSLEGGPEGAATAAGWSAGLRLPMGAVNAARAAARPVVKAAARLQTSGSAPKVKKATEALLDLGEEGRALRSSALRGEEGFDDATREITSAVSDSERFADQILEASGVGMKRAPIARKMAEEGVDQRAAISASEGVVEDVWTELDNISANARGVGSAALRKLLGTKNRPGAVERAIQSIDPEDASDAFLALDQLKRDIGRAVRQAGRGAEPDANTEEALKYLYEQVREHLQNPGVWGQGAATVQREVNAAWVPFIRKSKGLSRIAQSDVRGLEGADPWEILSEGDPKKIAALLRQAGTAGNELLEKALVEALDAQGNIAGTLAKHYDIPEGVASGASEITDRVRRVKDALGQRIADASAARQLKDVEGVGGVVPIPGVGNMLNPATTARRLGRVEREFGQRGGSAYQGRIPRGGAATAAGFSEWMGSRPGVAKATDYTRDKVHGSELAQLDSDDQQKAVSDLMDQDPGFRARQRARAEQQDRKEGAR